MKDSTVLKPPEDELQGGTTVLHGRYRIEHVLGRGGVATVYKATRIDGAPVALKVLERERAEDPAYVERLRTEAQLGVALEHLPGLVHLVDHGDIPELGDRPFIAFEYVRARDLEGALPQAEACRIVRDAADAVAQLHARKVVHRDVKVSNLLVDEHDGRVRVIDLGFAFSEGDGWTPATAELTRSDQRPGTVAFMAPEQWLGERPTPKFDVYALGITLWKLLTGSTPYDENDPKELLQQKMEDECPPLSWLKLFHVDEELATVIGRALMRDPERRLGSAAELRDALDGIQKRMQPPKTAEPETPGKVAKPNAGRSRELTIAAFLAVAFAVVTVGFGASWGVFTRMPMARVVGTTEAAMMAAPIEVVDPDTKSAESASESTGEAAKSANAVEVRDDLPAPAVIEPESVISGGSEDTLETEVEPLVEGPPGTTDVSDPPQAPPRPSTPSTAEPKAPTKKMASQAFDSPECVEARARATAASEDLDWAVVFDATRDAKCFKIGERRRLRVKAFYETKRYEACVREAGKDPTFAEIASFCRERLQK